MNLPMVEPVMLNFLANIDLNRQRDLDFLLCLFVGEGPFPKMSQSLEMPKRSTRNMMKERLTSVSPLSH